MADEATLQEAVGDVAQAAGAVAAENASLEAALENATARVAVAEETAQALSDAALMTALGSRVDDIEEGLEEWRDEQLQAMGRLSDQVASLGTQLATALETIAGLVPPPPTTVAVVTDQSLTPQALSEVVETAAQMVDPTKAQIAPSESTHVVAAPKTRRVRLI